MLSGNSASARARELARVGEGLAFEHYKSRGYEVVARNWRSSVGEIDLVAIRDKEIVFCEVKTRSSLDVGYPEEAVGYAKQKKLRELAREFLSAHRNASWMRGASCVRFDVVSVVIPKSGTAEVTVFEECF